MPLGNFGWNKVTNIKAFERLGSGHFGDVYRGLWNDATEVALKHMRLAGHYQELEREASMLQSLNHPNIVRFFGVYIDQAGEYYLVMEYISRGSLDLLLQREKKKISEIDLLFMAKDAVSGLLYLHEMKVIHRDLALRNLLVGPSDRIGIQYSVKISDFGMSREASSYYKSDDNAIPFRWSAPEVLQYRKFSSMSDIWSFGVILWEMFSYGMVPYIGMTNIDVSEKVISGYKMKQPENCPNEIYGIMFDCWNMDPDQRPTCKEIFQKLEVLCNQASKKLPSNSSLHDHDNMKSNEADNINKRDNGYNIITLTVENSAHVANFENYMRSPV